MAELEDRWGDLGEFIRDQRRVGQLSLRKLSEMAGISNPYLSQIERGLRKPSAEILRQIAQALHISAETLYVRAGILEARDGEVDIVTEIRRDPFLNEEQKKTLVHIYESFRTEQAAVIDAELASLDLAAGTDGAPLELEAADGDEPADATGEAAGAADTGDTLPGDVPDATDAQVTDPIDPEGDHTLAR